MRVLVVLAVVQLFHEARGGVAEVDRDWLRERGVDVCFDRAVGRVDGVRFGCEGKIDDGLREGEVTFRATEKMHGIAGGEAEVQGFRSGEADVFYGHTDDAAGTVHGVFASFQHAAQPVESGVWVTVADALVQGGDDVVVLLTLFVVEEHAALHGLCSERLSDDGFTAACGEVCCDLQGVECGAGVAAGVGSDSFHCGFFCRNAGSAKTADGICEGAVEQSDYVGFGERDEGVDAATGEERGVDLKGGILCGGADEAYGASLNIGQEGVLLGLVEAMDLVYEEDGAGAEAGEFFGFDHDLFDLFDAAEDSGEFNEAGLGSLRDDFGEGGFADAGRTPEDHGGRVITLNGQAEWLARGKEVLLAGVLLNGAGAHFFSEWRLRGV